MKKDKKQALTPEALELVAARFKMLAEPIRLSILQFLQDGEMSVSGITEAVASTQPNISKHLKMLQDAGIVSRRQVGNNVYYSIADVTIFDLCDVVCFSLRKRLETQSGVLSLK